MQEHILKKSNTELERTHRLVENYKDPTIVELLYSFFGKSFKNQLIRYAEKKEEILLNYSSLYSDIGKDILDPKAKAIDLESVRKSIGYITDTMKECGDILETLISTNKIQDEIIEHEKLFFVDLLSSFHLDLQRWIGAHEKEIFGEISNLDNAQTSSPILEGKALLELQKKRLELHLENIKETN